MKKLLPTAIFIFLGYILPLLWKPDLLLNNKIILLIFACFIIFITQPTFDPNEAQAKQQTDKYSVLLILICSLIGIAAPIIEWAYLKPTTVSTIWFIPGLSLLILGIVVRVWAIRTLGKFFTATVQVKSEHQLVKNGPYNLVRHPSYLGAFLAFVGSAVILEAWWGLMIAILAMLIAYSIRIKTEEITLVHNFGEQYKEYQARTKRLIPYIW